MNGFESHRNINDERVDPHNAHSPDFIERS